MDKTAMDSDNISSPVDPDPKPPSENPIEPSNTDNNSVLAACPPSHQDNSSILDDDDIDSILRQNQKFIEEHSIDPILPDVHDSDDKTDDVKQEEIQETEDKVIEREDETVNAQEILSEDIVAEVNNNQLYSLDVSEQEGPTQKVTLDICEDKLENEDNKTPEETPNQAFEQKPDHEILETKESDSFQSAVLPEETTKASEFPDSIMAEPEPESCLSPCADCKYRWSKVVDTSSTDIGFYPSYSKGDPILLSWDSALKAYYSVDQNIVCGDYHGNLAIDGNVYPVEQFNIRSYTFEVDLFMKDDVIEEETKPVNSVGQQSVQTADSHSKMENSLKEEEPTSCSQEKNEVTSQSTEDFINSVTSSLKFENLTKRHSPVGDDAVKTYDEFSPIKNGTDERLDKSWSSRDNIKDDADKRPSSRTSNRSSNSKQNDIVDDIIGNSPNEDLSRISSTSIRSHGSEERDVRSVRSISGHSPLQFSSHNSARESPSNGTIYRRPPSSSSDKYPAARSGRPGSDVDGSLDRDDQKLVLGSQSRMTPTRDLTPTHSRPQSETSFGRDRVVENGDHPSGSRPPSHPGSRHGSSNHSSRAQSLSSITSEQELGQYMGHGSRSSSVDRSAPLGVNGLGDDHPSPSGHHRDSPSGRPPSLPSYSQQQNTEVRIKTPDNRIRVPQSPADLTGIKGRGISLSELGITSPEDRTSVLSNAGSRASSRTVTPSFSERENFSPQVKDLEDSVANLRKLLTKREAEVHSLQAKISDLKDINRSLQDDLEHAKRHRPGTNEDTVLELKQTIAEKEILATEVVSLRDELQRLRVGNGRRSTSSEISDYSPNNPTVLQRKIADMESHMRDLQEAHESATTKLGKAESKIRSLQDENKELKSCSLSIADLQEVGGHNLRVEMVTLREDLRNLKERNFQLTEENLRLSEATKSKDTGVHSESKLSSSFRSDDGVIRSQQTSQHREKSYRPSYSNYTDSRSALPSQYKMSREDLAPKDLRHVRHEHSFKSERSHHDSNSRPLLQRESIESSRLRYAPKKDSSHHSIEASKSSMLYSDRSLPDGEIAEKLQSQRLSDIPSSYDRTSLSRDRSPRPHSNIHDFRPRDYSKEHRTADRLLSDRYGAETSDRDYQSRSSGSALNSKEIFYNLKQKRANQWLQQVHSKLNTSTDSENTDTLMAITSSDEASKFSRGIMNGFTVNGGSDLPTDNWLNDYHKYVSGNLQGSRPQGQGHRDSPRALYADDTADDSDTATDILLAQESAPRETSNIRVNSPDESLSSLSDGDGESNRLRRRSKSVEFNRSNDGISTRLLRSGSATRPLNQLDSSRNSSGLRSVIPPPTVTQHNKSSMGSASSLLNSSLTQGMRPFAPCNPSDVRSGDVVKFSRVGGKLTQGVVKYVGHLPGRSDAYLGVELDKDEGKHDGTFEGIRYFKCKPSKGVFVAFNKIVMAWAP